MRKFHLSIILWLKKWNILGFKPFLIFRRHLLQNQFSPRSDDIYKICINSGFENEFIFEICSQFAPREKLIAASDAPK